jgi:hypothetical protein
LGEEEGLLRWKQPFPPPPIPKGEGAASLEAAVFRPFGGFRKMVQWLDLFRERLGKWKLAYI